MKRENPKRTMKRAGTMNTQKRAKNQKKKTGISQNEVKVNIIERKKPVDEGYFRSRVLTKGVDSFCQRLPPKGTVRTRMIWKTISDRVPHPL